MDVLPHPTLHQACRIIERIVLFVGAVCDGLNRTLGQVRTARMPHRRRRAVVHSLSRSSILPFAAAVLALCMVARAQNPANGTTAPAEIPAGITTTKHPPLPGHPSLYWLAPELVAGPAANTDAGATRLARGAMLIDTRDFVSGLPLVQSASLKSTPLAAYARYYTGIALLGLRRFEDADDEFDSIDDDVDGYLREAVPLRRAEIAVALGEADDAVDILDDLADEEALNAPEEVLLRLAQALEAAGEREKTPSRRINGCITNFR